jgi:hypothetical protein
VFVDLLLDHIAMVEVLIMLINVIEPSKLAFSKVVLNSSTWLNLVIFIDSFYQDALWLENVL